MICIMKYLYNNKKSYNIQMYVISLRNKNRLQNIKIQEEKMGQSVQIFDAVNGDSLNIAELFENGMIDTKYKHASDNESRVIGCYMSHLQLLHKIKNQYNGYGYSGYGYGGYRYGGYGYGGYDYTIIFEDDFEIVSSDFMEDVNQIIKKMSDFDIILLGNYSNNKGNKIIGNIYEIDYNKELWGTYGYIVKNKNVNKIINHIKKMNAPIDDTYKNLAKNKLLKIYVINPTIVNHHNSLPSTIIK